MHRPLRKHWLHRLGIAAVCWWAFLVTGRTSSDDRIAPSADSASSFKLQWRAHADRLAAPLRNISCRFSAVVMGRKNTFHLTGKLHAKDRCRDVESVFDENSPTNARVVCRSRNGAFALEKSVKDAPYALSFFDDGDSQARARLAVEFEMIEAIDSQIEAATRVYDMPVASLLDGGATIRSVETAASEGKPYVEVVFELPSDSNYKDARVRFDPSWDWAITDYEIAVKSDVPVKKSARTGHVEYQRLSDGHVFPRVVRVETESILPSGKRAYAARTTKLLEVRQGGVTDSQFTLAAYGLPEMAPRGQNRYYPLNRWYFWLLIVIGIVCVIYLRRRTRAAA